jgi:hypothetical protein
MKYLILLLCLCGLFAQAQTAPQIDLTFTWQPPTTRADGTPMKATEIASYSFEYKLKSATEWKVTVLPSAAVTHKISNLPAGQYEARIIVSDTGGLWSNYVTLQTASAPGAVQNFKVTPSKSLPMPGTIP